MATSYLHDGLAGVPDLSDETGHGACGLRPALGEQTLPQHQPQLVCPLPLCWQRGRPRQRGQRLLCTNNTALQFTQADMTSCPWLTSSIAIREERSVGLDKLGLPADASGVSETEREPAPRTTGRKETSYASNIRRRLA